MSSPAALRSRTTGVASPAKPPRSAISGRSSRRKAGRRWMPALDVGAAGGGGLAGLVGLLDEVGDLLLLARERARGPGRSRARGRPALGSGSSRISSTRSVSRSAGFARLIASLSSSPRPARPGAELREQDREALARRAACSTLLTRSRSTGELVLLERQQVLALAVAVVDLRQLRLSLGVPGSHSTNFSPISDCGPHRCTARWRGRARSRRRRCASDDRRLLVVGHVHRLDHADLRAGHLHVLAGHRRGHVVEDRAHLVARVAVALGAHPEHDDRAEPRPPARGLRAGGASVSLPGQASGSQSPTTNGAEPSGGAWSAPPGQRRF